MVSTRSDFSANTAVGPITTNDFLEEQRVPLKEMAPSADQFIIIHERNRPYLARATKRLPPRVGMVMWVFMGWFFICYSFIVFALAQTSFAEIYKPGAVLMLGFCIILELAGIGFLIWLWWKFVASWNRLARDGYLITGAVLNSAIRKVSSKGGSYPQMDLSYRFTDPKTNDKYEKRLSMMYYGTAPAPGKALYVLFLNKNNYTVL